MGRADSIYCTGSARLAASSVFGHDAVCGLSHFDRLEIDEIVVRRLQVEEFIVTKRYVKPEDDSENA